MAIHEVQTNRVEGGFVKQIDEGSMRMVLDNLQKTQYSHPEKSTIRELASNGIDAIRERDIARSILTGKSKMEDHFVVREGSEYKDSYFNPDYYDLRWLGSDPVVYIRYVEGSALEKDKVIITDNGVGLGGDRLVGYFKLAYSTKRLSRFGLGKYGIGAKAALSTGAAFYMVKNRYNGKETWWNVYSYQVEPVIPKFDLNTGKENPVMDLANGTKCYYRDTNQPNGLEVILEVKKHHKQKYIDAVKSQLLYFENVSFKVEAHNGVVEPIAVKANILYEDDIMILSDNQMYSKPHILINRVNYGNVDFLELELEDKTGNISIKFKPEEVEVNPSREHVLWEDLTRESIKKRFLEVQKSAENMLQKELEETDFMKWLKACILVKNRINTEQVNTLIGRLSKLVDLRDYCPAYKPYPDFRMDKNLFAGVSIRKITSKMERQGSTRRMMVERLPAGLTDLVSSDIPVFVQRDNTNSLRDRYLLEDVYQQGFITIWLNATEVQRPDVSLFENEEEAEKHYLNRKEALYRQAKFTATDLKYCQLMESTLVIDAAVERVLERWRKLNEFILSSEGIEFYDAIEVPESYKERHKDKPETAEEEATIAVEQEVQSKEAVVSAEARRKLQGKTMLFTPRINGGDSMYEWHKLEIPVTDIDAWDNPEVYYSSDDTAVLLCIAAAITRPANPLRSRMRWKDGMFIEARVGNEEWDYNDNDKDVTISRLTAYDGPVEVKLVKVAKDRVKYYRDFKHIKQFFCEVTKNKLITMSSKLIKWNTARYLSIHLHKLEFLTNFQQFSQDHHNKYCTLVKYCAEHYRDVACARHYKELRGEEYDDMIKHMDKVSELQIFASEHKDDPVVIANVVKELFGTGTEDVITDGCSLDMNIRNMLHELLEYAEPIGTLLNEIGVLTSEVDVISEDLETEIRNFIAFKKAGH